MSDTYDDKRTGGIMLKQMRNLILIIFMILLVVTMGETEAASCRKHPIYCHIKRLKPRINKTKAMKISNMIYKYAKKYGIKKTNISVAIAMQETSLNPKLSRRQNIIVYNKEMTEWKVVRGYTDICLFQFHTNTIVRQKLDPIKLKTDLSYCVEQHFKLMKKKHRICRKLGSEAWTCYHSKTPLLRKRYKEDVERYL